MENLPTKVLQPSFDTVLASRESFVNETTSDMDPDLTTKWKTTDLPQVEVIDEARIESLKIHTTDESERVQIQVVNEQEVDLVRGSSQKAEGTNSNVCTMKKDINLMDIEVVDDKDVEMVFGTRQEEQDAASFIRIPEKEVRNTSSKKMTIKVVDEKDVDVVVRSSSQEDDAAAKHQTTHSKQHLQRYAHYSTRHSLDVE